MKNTFKILIFVVFVGYMVLSLIIKIPEKLNNIIYAVLALVGLFFMFTNKESFGINDMFKKDKDNKNELS